jgi:hypothetical protein
MDSESIPVFNAVLTLPGFMEARAPLYRRNNVADLAASTPGFKFAEWELKVGRVPNPLIPLDV